jgi:hypothetical protein
VSAAAVDTATSGNGSGVVSTPTAETAPSSWRDTLPDDLKSDPSLQSFKDIPALAKSFIETKKMVGAKQGVQIPNEKSTPEEIAAFHKGLGVPDSPSLYQIKRPDSALDLGWDSQAEGEFFAAAHKAGLTPKQVQAAVDWYGKWERAKLEKARGEANETSVRLRTEWGPDYDAKVGRANRVIAEYGGQELADAFGTPGHVLNAAGRHPVFVKFVAALGDALVEHGAITGEGLPEISPDEALGQINDLNAQLKKLPEGHPRTSEIIDKIVALTNAANRRR